MCVVALSKGISPCPTQGISASYFSSNKHNAASSDILIRPAISACLIYFLQNTLNLDAHFDFSSHSLHLPELPVIAACCRCTSHSSTDMRRMIRRGRRRPLQGNPISRSRRVPPLSAELRRKGRKADMMRRGAFIDIDVG